MKVNPRPRCEEQTSEILILSNGDILMHNLTPTMARLLAHLDPGDIAMRSRAESGIAETSVPANDSELDNPTLP